MKHNEHIDWIEAMRQSLRDAEVTPPADGWERLRQALGQPAPDVVPEAVTGGAPHGSWRISWLRIAAAAAVVLVCVVAGGFLLRPDRRWVQEGNAVASAVGSVPSAPSAPSVSSAPSLAVVPPPSGPALLSERLAGRVGLSGEPSDPTSSPIRRQTLLAAAAPAERSAGEALRPAGPEPSAKGLSVPAGASGQAVPRLGAPVVENTLATPLSGTSAPAAATAPALRKAEAAADAADVSDVSDVSDVAADAADVADAVTRRAVGNGAAPAGRIPQGVVSESFVAQRQPHKRASFSLHAGGGLSGGAAVNPSLPALQMSASNAVSQSVGTGDRLVPMSRFDAEDNTYRHHQPLSFGVSVAKEFRHGLSLESGVVYTLVRSDVQTRYSSEDVSQKLHFIGIPLRINWRFLERGRFSLYIGAGGMAEKCVSARFGSTSVDEPAVQWSALAAVGTQYRLGDFVALYFEPEGSCYFTQTRLRTLRTESPVTLSLRLGVRLSF